MRPLPDLDLARIAPLPNDQKWHALRQMKLAYPPYSYLPTRRVLPDLLNVDAGPLGMVPRAPWAQIAEEIVRRSRTEVEKLANLAVGEALYAFASDHSIMGRRHEFFPLTVGLSEKVTYWVQAVISLGGRPTVPFIDPRRSKKLTSEGRRFAFSVMHERIRMPDPDFAGVELAIIQFDVLDEAGRLVRRPKLHIAADLKLYDFDTIDSMVRETYEVWQAVLAEREAETRRRGTGTTGPLL